MANATTAQLSTIADAVLMRGLDDCVQACEVVSLCMEITGNSNSLAMRGIALQVIQYLLESDLMQAGDVANDGFKPWNLDHGNALAKIETVWPPEFRPSLGDVCWLRSTPYGDDRGTRAYQRAQHCETPSNYALERSVRGLAKGAAGAWESLAPAAPETGVPRPAQRGR